MSKDPAFLFYSSDFLTGTMMMDDEQVGKYIRLLCAQHQKGHLTEKHMLNICKTYDDDIFQKFIKDEDGLYFNVRLDEEKTKRSNYSKSRSENRKSKDNSDEKQKDMINISDSYVKHMENENENVNRDVIIDDNIPYKDIINYLNLKAGTNYKHSSSKTKDLIKARFNNDFTFDDFKKVIDNKCSDWLDDEKYSAFLRPDTLFSNKFEGYLNQKTKQQNIYNIVNGSMKIS